MGFRHLSCAERAVVFAKARQGSSQREIAWCLGRSAGTVCRKVLRARMDTNPPHLLAQTLTFGKCPQPSP